MCGEKSKFQADPLPDNESSSIPDGSECLLKIDGQPVKSATIVKMWGGAASQPPRDWA